MTDRGRLDWAVELCGASAAAAGAGFAAFKLAPVIGASMPVMAVGGSAATFTLAFMLMRRVRPEPRHFTLSDFRLNLVDEEPGELLLEERYEEPLLLVQIYLESETLLLEDALGAPGPDSRVVRLFAPEKMPTAGQLKERIDRHLADPQRMSREPTAPPPDASEALFAALADLRRSLR